MNKTLHKGISLNKTNLPLDLGFKVFKLSKSNFNIWNADVKKTPEAVTQQLEIHIDHIDQQSSQESILYEILLKSNPLEKMQIAGKTVFSIATGELLICLEKQLTLELIRAIAEKKTHEWSVWMKAFNTKTNSKPMLFKS